MTQNPEDLFVSAVNPYFRDRAEEIVANISKNTLFPTYPQDSWMRVNTMFQRLIRWDPRPPRIIFHTGFYPQVASDIADYPASAYDLRAHIEKGTPSIFVSTIRDYWNPDTDLMRWEPRPAQGIRRHYEYEIFVHGGLDANLLLGEHPYVDRHIVAFPGGIRPEFIRSAREYCNGKIVHVWWNSSFNPRLNPPSFNVPLTSLVHPLPTDGKVPSTFYVESFKEDILIPSEFEPRGETQGEDGNPNRLMTGEGTAVHVVEHASTESLESLLQSERPKVACFLHPREKSRVFFFCANNYALINLKPGTTDDTIAWGPKLIRESWPSLVKAEFGYVDAVLPNPNRTQEVYVFFRDKYALIDIVAESTNNHWIDGPWRISAEWPCLHQARFQTIDAVLPNPKNKKEAYFFCGSKYAIVNVAKGPNEAFVVNGPKHIQASWPSLAKAGFETIDAALPNPRNSNEAYFFSGDKYALVKIKTGTTDDYVVNGPKLIRTEWPSLVECGFW